MADVRLTSLARADVDAIWSYVAQDSATAADRLVDRFFETSRLYATQPSAGVPGDRFKPGIRYFAVGSYVVFYQAQSNGILVLRVLHGSRDLAILFRDQGEEMD
jgi:toxin ParE1/3/4